MDIPSYAPESASTAPSRELSAFNLGFVTMPHSDNPGRHTNRDGKVRNRLAYDSPSADDGASADLHAIQHNDVGPQPSAVADSYAA